MNAQQMQRDLDEAYAEQQEIMAYAARRIANKEPLRDIERDALDTLNFAISAELMDRDVEVAKYAQELPF